MLCCHHLEVLNNFEQGTSHFHFALGPTNYIAGSEGWWEKNSQGDVLRSGRKIASRKVSQKIMENWVDMGGPICLLNRTELPQARK